jgi:sulfur-carrier protein adenylyltransferase/sulfurtransferase
MSGFFAEIVMAKTYSDLLQEVKGAIKQVTLDEMKRRLDAKEGYTFVDVREKDETKNGFIPGAVLLPRGFLEMQAEAKLPDKNAKLVVYCAGGTRSAFAAKVLQEMGYGHVESANPGFIRWKDMAYPVDVPAQLTPAQMERYSRHLMLPEVGDKGQEKLLKSRVLLLGAGGLGSPAGLYLAAAGIGTIGLVDADVVDHSNLQRQVLHGTDRVGMLKVDSAEKTLKNLNPDVNVMKFQERMNSSNIDRILDHGWDVIVDGVDNFPTRYLLNDASVWRKIPVIHGSIFRFDGQVTTFDSQKGPCYRCLYPEPPPAHLAPSCAEAGVLGVLPGIIGVIQATEAIKLILGQGDPLIGRLLTYDSLKMSFRTLKLRKDKECPVCGEHPTITEYIDYEGFCSR